MVESAPTCEVSRIRDLEKDAIYVAGPMTGIINFNFEAFNEAASMLKEEGYRVVNPADHGVVEGANWSDYLRYDLQRLSECGAVFFLRGWERSRGAFLEWTVATQLGLGIHFQEGAETAPDSNLAKRALAL